MPEPNPAHPWTGELTAADLDLLGAKPLRRSDPVTIGPYRVLARLGGGGMGRLFLSRDADVDADGAAVYGAQSLVAVKVIRSEHAEDPAFRRRFEREVEAVRRVHGRYTAGLLGSGFDEDEHLWMATSYVPGLSLDEAIRRFGPLPAPVVWRLAGEIGAALASIAATGIVHRDLKPSNVLLGPDGARVIDFGVARTTDSSVLTMTGQQVGTPAFMSPEQAAGREVGTASDVFSLGSLLAHAATGRGPFGEGSTVDVLHRVVYSPPSEQVLGQLAQVDVALAELVRRCLNKDLTGRPGPSEVVDTAQGHAPVVAWPESLAELIGTRAGWSGHAAAVSPMDQLTVLRRGTPDHTVRQTPARGRRRLILGAAVAVVTVTAVVLALVGLPGEDASPSASAEGAVTTPTQSASQPKPSTSQPVPRKSQSPPQQSEAPAQPQEPRGNHQEPTGNDEQPTHEDDQSAPDPPRSRPTRSNPPEPPAPSAPARPWDRCTYYSGTALTKYGDKGNRVREVQCILLARTYNIGPAGVDGDFGPDTQAAVKRFQQKHHLDVDGEVGVDTWPALRG